MSIQTMPRYRTLNAAHALILEIDPDCGITKHFLRALAISGRIKIVMAGRRRLINVDAFLDRLANDPASLSEPMIREPLSPIRRVATRR